MKYAVCYFPNATEIRYVGSVSDYIGGGFADPVLMCKEDAESLLDELDNYVRDKEVFSDRDAALYAYDHNEWGFGIEELDTDFDMEE